MKHEIINRVKERVASSKEDSDFTYFWSLLLLGEAIFKTATLGALAAIMDDPDRNRYRLEHDLVKAEGLGDWAGVMDDVVSGPAAQFLISNAYPERNELTRICTNGEWQYDSMLALKQTLDSLRIDAEELPTKSNMRRWFRLFATLRNKTRAHGATLPSQTSAPAASLELSIDLFINNYCLFRRPWVYLHRNLSGKYRVSPVTEDVTAFDHLKRTTSANYQNGVYIHYGSPRLVPLLRSDADFQDFYFPNGGLTAKKYECLSYATDNKCAGDATTYYTPPGSLPGSVTEGLTEFVQRGRCLSNAPDLIQDYVSRRNLEDELYKLLMDDRHPIITLLGRGGTGKTSLALQTIDRICKETRFEAIMWLSARDVDLQFTGPKAVRPHVLSPHDMSRYYASLVLPEERRQKGFNSKEFFEKQLQKNDLGPCLFIFDNFETSQTPTEVFTWIDTFLRLPNKALITTRMRDFKGDYPVEVGGMEEDEANTLIQRVSHNLGVSDLLNPSYVNDLIRLSEGHPYIIKILLGEVAKEKRAGHISRIVANRDEVLVALFERTYALIPPCAQRVFMTLAAWNSAVPRIALEAVLHRTIPDGGEVERSIDLLLLYSLAERTVSVEGYESLSLPLVASVFGKRKLNVSPIQVAIKADVQLLQMLGPASRGDVNKSLAVRIEAFLGHVSRKLDHGETFNQYEPMIEMICRNYSPGWLVVARWYMEDAAPASLEKAKSLLRRFLEEDSTGEKGAAAWHDLAVCCSKTQDTMGEIHAFIERCKISSVPFEDLSSTANHLNFLLKTHALVVGTDEKRILAGELLRVMRNRRNEARASDYSRMAWLAIHVHDYVLAREFLQAGLDLEPENPHLLRLANLPAMAD